MSFGVIIRVETEAFQVSMIWIMHVISHFIVRKLMSMILH